MIRLLFLLAALLILLAAWRLPRILRRQGWVYVSCIPPQPRHVLHSNGGL